MSTENCSLTLACSSCFITVAHAVCGNKIFPWITLMAIFEMVEMDETYFIFNSHITTHVREDPINYLL